MCSMGGADQELWIDDRAIAMLKIFNGHRIHVVYVYPIMNLITFYAEIAT